MAHFASKRFSYAAQFGILLAFVGVGFIIAAIASIIPLLSKINFADIGKMDESFLNKLMIPENANAFRWMQFLSTFFAFFLPPVCYAWLCHKKAALHLGFKNSIDIKQAILTIVIMLACLPLVGALQNLTEMFPWSKTMLQKFKEAEVTYTKQVAVIGRMNGVGDYIISMIMIALLPAVFEEVAFRGGLQNLLTRWFKAPVIAIVVTSILFSAIHMSYLGFLSRFALGFILGWVYYKTGNLWLSILAHFFNNAIGVTVLYMSTKPGQPVNTAAMEDSVPLWAGALSLIAAVALMILFEKFIKKDIAEPGEEIIIPDENASPFTSLDNNENINGTVQH